MATALRVKILELGKFYAPERGGIETLLRSLCEGFVGLGAEVDCVVANRTFRTVHETLAGVRVHRLASWREAMSISLTPRYPFATRRFRADLWHAHFPNPLADLAAVFGPRRTPLILSWHSDIVRQKAALRFYLPLQRALLRRATRIVVATPYHLEYSSYLPEFGSKCVVIPYGLNLDRFELDADGRARVASLRREAGGRRILLNVGRLVGYKGHRYALLALQQLPSAVLWLVGTGPLEFELRALAGELGVTDRVRFWGDISDKDLPRFFHACDVFVFPSISPNEAFGLVQVEAMACGKPVIACQLRSGVPYVCGDGISGLTVPPANPDGLADAVNRLLSNDAYCLQLGAAGRRRAHAEFSELVMVQRYWDLIKDLVAERAYS
ncbi:MAG: glycosyltransferase [Pedosphaera sp.]|nr:glycosyltransferase [Pedosphaera sp.]